MLTSDSASGQVVRAVVRQLDGEQLKGKTDQLELEDMKPSLDSASSDAQKILSTSLTM